MSGPGDMALVPLPLEGAALATVLDALDGVAAYARAHPEEHPSIIPKAEAIYRAAAAHPAVTPKVVAAAAAMVQEIKREAGFASPKQDVGRGKKVASVQSFPAHTRSRYRADAECLTREGFDQLKAAAIDRGYEIDRRTVRKAGELEALEHDPALAIEPEPRGGGGAGRRRPSTRPGCGRPSG